MHIYISDFVRRQTQHSRFSYFEGPDEELLRRIEESFVNCEPSYRDGVLSIPISNVEGFYSGTCVLKEGDTFKGAYKARQPGEQPRKQIGVVGGQKIPAKRVDIILYSFDTLMEGNENSKVLCPTCKGKFPAVCSAMCKGTGWVPVYADWEVISINATASDTKEPMSVGTLLTNYFHEEGSNDGGTSTGMSDAELVAALRISFAYWKDKATIAE